MTKKKCNKCQEVKSEGDFHLKKVGETKTSIWCKPCQKVYITNYQAVNRVEISSKRQADAQARRELDKQGRLVLVSQSNCNRCRSTKPVEEFPKDYFREGGLSSRCRTCEKAKYAQFYVKNREKVNHNHRVWTKNNPEICRIHGNKRRVKIRRQPFGKIFEQDIKQVYLNAPKDMEVDHIIPINNELVSGLHVPWNLQYLTESENCTKKNRFDGTYDNQAWRSRLKK